MNNVGKYLCQINPFECCILQTFKEGQKKEQV